MRVRSIGFLVVLAAGAVFAGPAQSDTVLGCGSTLIESVVLDHDIGPCPGDGLVIEGGNVSVDLNGHAIIGSSSGTGVSVRPSIDVALTNVSVTNGSITGFEVGLGIFVDEPAGGCGEAGAIRVDRVAIRSNGLGVSIFGFGCETTILLSRNVVSNSVRDGILVGNVGPVSIVNNQIVGNGYDGIRAFFDCVRVIDGNFIARNAVDGIDIGDSVASITNNVLQKNGAVGLWIRESVAELIPSYYVADNVADGNGIGGMSASSFLDPPGPPAGQGNVAKHSGTYQCVLILCSANRGQARDPSPPFAELGKH